LTRKRLPAPGLTPLLVSKNAEAEDAEDDATADVDLEAIEASDFNAEIEGMGPASAPSI
jgi:hypothetical protein